MRLRRAVLWITSWLVPRSQRARWLEEWRAELRYARRSMILGAPRNAWAMRSLRSEMSRGPSALHALDQDVRYSLRSLVASPGFALGVVLSLSVGMTAMRQRSGS